MCRIKKATLLWLVISLSMLFMTATHLSAACPTAMDTATINEVYSLGDSWIEVKILDESLDWSGYNLRVCNKKGCVRYKLSDGVHMNGSWLVIYGIEISLNQSKETDILLLDGFGNPVDYLSINGGVEQFPTECPILTDDDNFYTTLSAPKGIFRSPDGTGTWSELTGTGATGEPTEGDSNDGDPLVGGVDHYELHHDGQGLTCAPETVIIKACTTATVPCPVDDLADIQSSVVLTVTNNGSWSPESVTFSGSTSVQLFDSQVEEVTIGLSGETAVCIENGTLNDCTLQFSNSGFVFDFTDSPSCLTTTAQLAAVATDPATGSCVPAFGSTTKNVSLWFEYAEPAANDSNTRLIVNGAEIDENEHSSLPLLFGNDAVSESISLKYVDAGRLNIHVAYDDGVTSLTGQDSVVFYPARFEFSSITPDWDGSAGFESSVFVKAGDSFNLTVDAVCGNGTPTPNYQASGVDLTHTLIAPIGGSSGSLGVNQLDFVDGQSSIDQTFTEVGVIEILATGSDYFGYTISGTSADFGRFTPDYFSTTVVQHGEFENSCGGFTYTGQSFSYSPTNVPQMKITAKNSTGVTTLNYLGDFVKLTDPGSQVLMHAVTHTLGSDATTLLNLTWMLETADLTANNNGTLDFTLGADQFVYTREANAMVAPFTSDIYLSVTGVQDSDGIVATDLTKEFIPTGINIRYGRMVLDNVYGPETLLLSLPIRTEYYNGSDFVLNSLDNCTAYSLTNILPFSNYQGNLEADELDQTKLLDNDALNDTLSFGIGDDLGLNPPTGGDDGLLDGSVDITFNLASTAPWLQFDWDGDGTNDNPKARATFGIYKGSEKIIYLRETTWR
ncbi:MAG: hypothetical protein J7K75_03060 [Desulfuromonas sp.]|nr:hypothetical protein [Desulfuromonas sp.]